MTDGTPVVVKVQRPGIDRLINTDIAILIDLAERASRRLAIASQLDAPSLVREFGWSLRGELDFIMEGRNADKLARIFVDDPGVRIPKVVWSHSAAKVLTMERLTGCRVDDLTAIGGLQVDRRGLAHRIACAYFQMIVDDGYFHADPHAGNIIVLPNGAIGLLDFGIVGCLDSSMRQRLLPLLLGFAQRDAARIAEEMGFLGVTSPETSPGLLERDIRYLLQRYYGRPLGEFRVAGLIEDVMGLIYRHKLRLPSDIALLMKTVVMCEAITRTLDPSFNIADVAETYLRREVRKLYSPQRLRRTIRTQSLELMILGFDLPRRLQRLLNRVDRQELTFNVHYDELPRTLSTLTELVNRMVAAILLAASFVGLALLYAAVQPRTMSAGWATFVTLFVLLAATVLRLLHSTRRMRRVD